MTRQDCRDLITIFLSLAVYAVGIVWLTFLVAGCSADEPEQTCVLHHGCVVDPPNSYSSLEHTTMPMTSAEAAEWKSACDELGKIDVASGKCWRVLCGVECSHEDVVQDASGEQHEDRDQGVPGPVE
jgi:hypothetical protein